MIKSGMGTETERDYIIYINKKGEWFYNGAEIVHPKILRIFNDGIRRDKDGAYSLIVEGDCAKVVVEDAPFVVANLTATFDGDNLVGFVGHLSDNTRETIDLMTVEIDENNVPYCMVKIDEEKIRGKLSARFSTTAYYALANYIQYDEDRGSYFIELKSKRFDIPYLNKR